MSGERKKKAKDFEPRSFGRGIQTQPHTIVVKVEWIVRVVHREDDLIVLVHNLQRHGCDKETEDSHT